MSRSFVFLHGGGQGGWVWDDLIAALRLQGGERIGACLVLDVVGCGKKRGRPTAEVEVADLIDDLLADIDAAALGSAILVGHSQAGTILPRLLKARPALFAQVVYVSCVAPIGEQTSLSWLHTMPGAETSALGSASGPPPGSRERFRMGFCNDMAEAEAEAFLDQLGPDQWPASSYRMTGWDYDHLDAVPSTYVQCLKDMALQPDWQAIFAERLQARAIVHIDAGHQAMNTRPHALAEILRAAAR